MTSVQQRAHTSIRLQMTVLVTKRVRHPANRCPPNTFWVKNWVSAGCPRIFRVQLKALLVLGLKTTTYRLQKTR